MANNNKHTGPNVPALRFPEFSGEWKTFQLSDLAAYSKERVKMEILSSNNYVSTENMQQDFAGIKDAISLPSSGTAVEFQVGDILISNIRPYLKKTWLSDRNGGCSTDVLALRTKNEKVDSSFLYCCLANDDFVSYVMSGAKGVKMPRGDKQHILSYNLGVPSVQEQRKIAELVSLLEKRISAQSKIIEELTTLRSALLEKVFQVSNPTLEVGAIAHQTSERNKLCRYSNVLSVSNRFGFINQSEQFEDRNVASDDVRNYKVVHRGDFAYNPARINVGSIAMLKSFESGIVSPMYICFQVDDTIVDPSFFELFLETKAFKDEMEIRLEGSVRRCLSFEALCEIHLPLPALLVQRSISDKIGNISSKIKLEDRILRAYIRQKEWLLKQMFI